MSKYIYVVREKYTQNGQFHTNLLRAFTNLGRAANACRAYQAGEDNPAVTIWVEAYDAKTGYFATEIEVTKP